MPTSTILRTGAMRALMLLHGLMLAGAAVAAPSYQATVLGLPGGASESRVWGIANGLIVGETFDASLTPRATVWLATSPGTAVPLLNALPFASSALAVSGAGVIAGYGETLASPTDTRALRWPSAGDEPVPVGAAGGGSEARAVAGNFTAGATLGRAFLFDGSTLTTLGDPGAIANGVRADGVAVGQSAAGEIVVFNGANAGVLSPFGLSAGPAGAAHAILGGLLIGSHEQATADPLTFTQRAFSFDLAASTTVELFAGAAFALNAAGSIVGADFDAGVAMLYEGGFAYDLNGLVPTASLDGFTLRQARGIDDNGSIVAFGTKAGVERAFLLTLDAGGNGGSGGTGGNGDPGGGTGGGSGGTGGTGGTGGGTGTGGGAGNGNGNGNGNGTGTPVPEPATWALVLTALASLRWLRPRRGAPALCAARAGSPR